MRSFVERRTTTLAGAKIYRTLIQVAHNLGCQAVAIGISAEPNLRFRRH